MALNPAESSFFDRLQKDMANNPPKPFEEQSIAEFRAGGNIFLQYTGKPADISYTEKMIIARDGYKIPIRIYHDDLKEITPVLIFYPGCGYVADLFEPNAIAASRIAKYAGIKVIVVNYRLAPENPLPIPIYDGYDATQYIATHAKEFNINPEKIFIGGISSGAHCAAMIANLARHDDKLNIYHQILLNGCFDLTQSNHEYDAYEKEDKICSRTAADFIFKQYGISTSEFSHPLFSPYYEKNLTNLPPTTFIVGEYDGLRNDTEGYYLKMSNANNNVEKIILPGQTHNTLIMREAMSDGPDPAEVIADIIKKNLN